MINELGKMRSDITVGDKEGITPIHLAASDPNQMVLHLLLKHYDFSYLKKAVNIPMKNGATPLFIAAQLGYNWHVNFLVALGADVNEPIMSGMTPLMVAVQKNAYAVVNSLLKNAKNKIQ